MKYLFIGVIRLYQKTLAKWLTPACRFVPSCSEYACVAIMRFGIFKGGALAFWRICRCNPFSAGGLDPVPDKKPRVKRKTSVKGQLTAESKEQ